jgi:ketosteroid isomerase-like protein
MPLKKITLITLILIASNLLHAQTGRTKEQQQVQETIVKFFDALSSRDTVGLKAHCTSDITLFEYGQAWNLDTLTSKVATMQAAADFKRTNSFEFLDTRIDKKMAWASYRLNSSITRDGQQTTLQWIETIVLAKDRKQWKVNHLHSTLLKRN